MLPRYKPIQTGDRYTFWNENMRKQIVENDEYAFYHHGIGGKHELTTDISHPAKRSKQLETPPQNNDNTKKTPRLGSGEK